jgi:hypothetical protein
MAELYLDDNERRIIANVKALVNAARPRPTSPSSVRKADEDTSKDVANAVSPEPVSPSAIRKADEDTTKDVPVSVPVSAPESPSLSVFKEPTREERMTQLKQARESNYFTKQSLLKGEKPQVPDADENYTYDYVWHVFAGGGGEWRLVRYPKFVGVSSSSSNNNNSNNNNNNSNNNNNNSNNNNTDGNGTVVNGGQTTNIDVLKSLLRGMGFTTSLIDSSADYLNRLLKDGLDYDNAIAIFLDSKEYTFKNGQKVTSPFYTAYGYLNEGLTVPKSAAELFSAVEGYKGVVAKYALSDKYISSDSLKKYVKNNVSVSELDERANAARLKAINADPSYTSALKALGYIKADTDLTDFFLNPDIGKEVLEQNRATAAFSAEAIRRSQLGVVLDAERFKQVSAGLLGRGLNEEEISVLASKGFENIGTNLRTTQKLSGIYEGLNQAQAVSQIQQELESEEFLGIASQRRKRLEELETRAFEGAAGTTTSSLRTRAAGAI